MNPCISQRFGRPARRFGPRHLPVVARTTHCLAARRARSRQRSCSLAKKTAGLSTDLGTNPSIRSDPSIKATSTAPSPNRPANLRSESENRTNRSSSSSESSSGKASNAARCLAENSGVGMKHLRPECRHRVVLGGVADANRVAQPKTMEHASRASLGNFRVHRCVGVACCWGAPGGWRSLVAPCWQHASFGPRCAF